MGRHASVMASNAFGGTDILPVLFAPAIVALSQKRIKKAAAMKISLKKQLSMLVFAAGFGAFEASFATPSVAKQGHVRHHSASAERTAGRGSREIWNNPIYGYAQAPFRGPRHYYPDPFRGDCTLDDGPFPCGSDP